MKTILCALAILIVTGYSSTFAADGYCTVDSGTNWNITGGAGGITIVATNKTSFTDAVTATGPRVVIVQGTIPDIGDSVIVKSDKTIQGDCTVGGTVTGQMTISGISNLIVSNLTMVGNNGVSTHCMEIVSNAKHVFVTHCDLSQASDECLSVTKGADYVTVSWCKFHYANSGSHQFGHLIGSADPYPSDVGKLNVTFHHNWYSTHIMERMPRVRYGHVHIYNNYYACTGNVYCVGVGYDCHIRLENTYFDGVNSAWADYHNGGPIQFGWNDVVTNGTTSPSWPTTNSYSTIYPIPYSYSNSLDSAANVKSIVMAGVGPQCANNPTPPTITQQPQSTTNCAGGTATFSITATGDAPLSYQWQTNSVNLVNGGDFSGVTSNVLTVSPVSATDAGSYRCIVTNAAGSVTSSNATLTVNALPALYTVGGGGSYCSGGSGVTLTLSSSESGVTYYLQLGGSNTGATLPGTGSGLNFTGVTAAGTYGILASNTATSCTQLMSGTVTVTVNPRPTSVVSGSAVINNGGTTIIQAALTGTGPWNLTWSDGTNQNGVASSPAQRSVSPSATTTYTVTALSDANCTAEAGDRTGSAVVTVLVGFEWWQWQYFNCTNCPAADPNADPDGDGQNNMAEFLSGTDPTNSASALRITSAVQQTTDVVITWTTAGGHTNAVQATAGDANGGYTTNNFEDITVWPHIIIDGSGDATTNYVDGGGATNSPSRYYRIRLVP